MGKKTDSKLKNFVKKVKEKYKVEKMILFGSRARGDNLKNSDYDVIIVSDDFKKTFFTKRISNILKFWNNYPLEIEPICYTQEEFNKKKNQIGIVKKAVEEGIEI